MAAEAFTGSQFMDGVTGSQVWLVATFGGWWIMFRAPLGRRVYRHSISIKAPARKIWSTYFHDPSPPGGWGGYIVVKHQDFLDGAPLRHRAVIGSPGRPDKTMTLITRVSRLDFHKLFEGEVESIDGVQMKNNPPKSMLLLTEADGVTLIEQEVNTPVKGVFGHLSTSRLYDRYLEHLRASCEDEATPAKPTPLIGRAAGAWLAVAAIAASALVFGLQAPKIGWVWVIVAFFLELAILVHEFGHYFAMRWFGHRDASIMFIPFFGGATIGLRPMSSRFEKAVIALAGPGVSALVVLVLTPVAHWGVTAIASGWNPFIELRSPGVETLRHALGIVAVTFLIFAIPINLFNLAPVGMLDGARVMAAVTRSRPWQAVFACAVIAAMAFTLRNAGDAGLIGAVVVPLVAFWIYGFVSGVSLDDELAPMNRAELTAVLAAFALTLLVYAHAAQTLLPEMMTTLQNVGSEEETDE